MRDYKKIRIERKKRRKNMSYSIILIIMIGVIDILFLLVGGLYMYIKYGENYIVCFLILILSVVFLLFVQLIEVLTICV